MAMFTTFTTAADIGALALGSGSYCLAPPSSGGVELGITVFNQNIVDNANTYSVLEVYACETLFLITLIQKRIRLVQGLGPLIIKYFK